MEKFILNRSLLVVSFVCNNKCKLCGVLSPFYDKPPHFKAKELCKTIDSYFSVVDHVNKFTLSGGEPMIHPEIDYIVKHIKKYESQYNKLEIITNGKVLMNEKLVDELTGFKKAELLIDDYGINSESCKELSKQAESIGISVNYRIYYGKNSHLGGWFDMGDFSKRDRSEGETEEVFKLCGMMKEKAFGLFIVGGEGHVCFRSWRTMDLGIVDKYSHADEFVDFNSDEDIEVKRERINGIRCREIAFQACSYCWGQGDNLPRYPAGEQI